MNTLKSIKNTLLTQNIKSAFSWGFIALTVLSYFYYDKNRDQELALSIFEGLLFVSLFFIITVFLINYLILKKRDDFKNNIKKKLLSFIDSADIQNDKDWLNHIRFEWEKFTPQNIFIDSNILKKDISLKLIEYLNSTLNKKEKSSYIFNFEKLNIGELDITLIKNDSEEFKKFNNELTLLKILEEFTDQNTLPKIEINSDFESRGITEILFLNKEKFWTDDESEAFVNSISQVYELPNDSQWFLEIISLTAFKLIILPKDSVVFKRKEIESFIKTAINTSKQLTENNPTENSDIIEIVSISSLGILNEFTVEFSNPALFKNNASFIRFAKTMIRVLKTRFPGDWKSSTRITQEGVLTFKRF